MKGDTVLRGKFLEKDLIEWIIFKREGFFVETRFRMMSPSIGRLCCVRKENRRDAGDSLKVMKNSFG